MSPGRFSSFVVGHARDSFFIERLTRSSPAFTNPSFFFIDRDGLYDLVGLRPGKIDRQQSVPHVGTKYLHAVGQHETALELAGGDAAMKELPYLLVVRLLAPDDKLILLDADVELVAGEPC